jgi:hypothetical protein
MQKASSKEIVQTASAGALLESKAEATWGTTTTNTARTTATIAT